MLTFSEYQDIRTLRNTLDLLQSEAINPEDFIPIFEAMNANPDQLYTELLSGLSNMVGTGLGGVANMLGAGMRGVGRGIGAAAGAVGNAVGGAANAAWQGAQRAGQGIANTYMQGENEAKIQKGIGLIQNLQSQLQTMGFNNPEVDSLLRRLVATLQKGMQQVQQNSSLRFGQPGIWRTT